MKNALLTRENIPVSDADRVHVLFMPGWIHDLFLWSNGYFIEFSTLDKLPEKMANDGILIRDFAHG